MSKYGSLKYQVLNKINSLKRFGQSKHKAKQAEKARCKATGERWNPLRVEGIFSHTTCDAYRERALEFVCWEKQNYPEQNRLHEIPKLHVQEYLEHMQHVEGKSPYTVRQAAAAMAKVMDCRTPDFGFKLPKRELSKITRSRGIKEHDRHFSTKNNADLIDFCRATGLRRTELEALKPEHIFQRDDRVIVHVERNAAGKNPKGGRERYVNVTQKGQDHVWAMKERAERNNWNHVFVSVHSKMDVHSYRAEYATTRYAEEVRPVISEGRSGEYHSRLTGEIYDRQALETVSQDLGHNRVDVVVNHYLR